MTALCQILHLFTDLNIPITPGKTFPACTSLEFMGILLDANKMEARLPVDKLTDIPEALGQQSNSKSATLRELQSVIGTLQFAWPPLLATHYPSYKGCQVPSFAHSP